MAITEKMITLCGHGSGTPSLKNMNTYLTVRYNAKAANGKRKGIVKVMRLKALTDANRKKFHDTYQILLGRNVYSQALRNYVYVSKLGKYYSDCSSSGMATFKKLGYNVSLLNTAGIYRSALFSEVPVNISNGHITNPEILKVGDALLFVGNDPSRPLQIGHVEFVYEINGTTVASTTSASSTASAASYLPTGLTYAKNFTGVKDTDIKKAKARVVQHAMNLDYGKSIDEDGMFGPKSKAKLGTHYVRKGEKQYMVTAAEILMYLSGINPKGVETPGIYGNGMVAAAKAMFGGDGSKITAAHFLTLIQS